MNTMTDEQLRLANAMARPLGGRVFNGDESAILTDGNAYVAVSSLQDVTGELAVWASVDADAKSTENAK